MKKKRKYFEGWYLKQQNGNQILALIPAYHIDAEGKGSASIQIITEEASYYIPYKEEACNIYVDKGFYARIGNCIFTPRGCRLQINRKNIKVEGFLDFTNCVNLPYSIMGPFEALCMPCKHSIFSMHHKVRGLVRVNGKSYKFYDHIGYMEGDRGNTFPRAYMWLQSNSNQEKIKSIMLSVAEIPILKCGNYQFGKLKGCIGVILYKDFQIRFATYLGAKVRYLNESCVVIQQGNMMLQVWMIELGDGKELRAPIEGEMTRKIKESVDAKVRYRLSYKGKTIFDEVHTKVALEYENGTDK